MEKEMNKIEREVDRIEKEMENPTNSLSELSEKVFIELKKQEKPDEITIEEKIKIFQNIKIEEMQEIQTKKLNLRKQEKLNRITQDY